MKKIMAAAIVLVFAGAAASWGLVGLEDVSFDGSLEVSGVSANNETDFSPSQDRRGGTNTRVRLGISATVTEDVKGRLELTRTGRQYGTGATTVAGEEVLWQVQNAYIDLGEHFTLTNIRLGRQYVGEPGDLVWDISPINNDNLTVNAIDGILLEGSYLDEMLDLSIFTGKAVEDDGLGGTDNGDATGDINLSNIEVIINKVIPEGRIRAAYIDGNDDNADDDTLAVGVNSDDNKLRIYRLGVDGGLNEGAITYKAEYLMNAGEYKGMGGTAVDDKDLDYKGTAIDLGVGYNSPETDVGTFKLAVNYVMASGDDDVTDTDDESFHDFNVMGQNTSGRLFGEIAGKSSIMGGTGIDSSDLTGSAPNGNTQGQGMNVLHIGGKYVPTLMDGKLSLAVDFFSFTGAEDTVKDSATTTANVGDDIATEVDITLGYNPSDNVGIELGYATLSPDDVLTGVGAANDDNVEKLFARAKVKWGGEE